MNPPTRGRVQQFVQRPPGVGKAVQHFVQRPPGVGKAVQQFVQRAPGVASVKQKVYLDETSPHPNSNPYSCIIYLTDL